MEEALVTRLRASSAVIAAAGTHNSRPAVDWIKRPGNSSSVFPSASLSIIAPGRTYDHEGTDGLQSRRVRIECFGLSYIAAKVLSRAIIGELEVAAVVGGVRFHRGRLQFERDMDPEDIGSGVIVHRTILDFIIPTTEG